MNRTRLAAALALALAACGSSDPGKNDAPLGDDDAFHPDASATACPRDPAAPDRARHLVIAHPYDGKGDAATAFEVLNLSATGELSRGGATFDLGRAPFGTIQFTPDGEVGIVPQDDGTLGIFTLAGDGTPTVVEAAFHGGFYADRIVPDPHGDGVWIVDGNTRENGGGIYRVDLACDGTPTDKGLVAAGSTPGGLALVDDTHAVVAGGAVLDSAAGDDVDLLSWGAQPSRLGGADAFGDDNAIIGGSALTGDGTFYLVGDVSQFSGVDNRVAVVSVGASGVAATTVLTPVEDPEGIATAPNAHVGIVTSAFGNKIFVVDDNNGAGWRVRGEVAYQGGGKPQLPGDVAEIHAGTLNGHVFVSENVGVRQLVLGDDGSVTDVGSLTFGDGLDQVAGAIGVQP